MSYDSNGMRTQKIVDGVKTNYYYDSNKNLRLYVNSWGSIKTE
nr:hypothetical protein [uncultured Ruminococcus sp.]